MWIRVDQLRLYSGLSTIYSIGPDLVLGLRAGACSAPEISNLLSLRRVVALPRAVVSASIDCFCCVPRCASGYKSSVKTLKVPRCVYDSIVYLCNPHLKGRCPFSALQCLDVRTTEAKQG